ncbi:DNA-directed RNA polymerase sigma-70 factor [Actinoplanes ianthinogenes]|uniref:DNA-directed RNA polymerase sigma-70 factor n=1 Tax=Actinoplanes ianthinogenes TaxID=122358 RepID=A0ABM7LJN7_9ACTN|nr:sigma-70 family RNA polymerase sigma factor [Actinoplanes ianthinogenes]BCJ39477.1 DNA-directed RNA polymerase sigma-70 factor [Actinoplanes ianthinogenes]GGR35813.1 DNA-directed RNA polymerase sigma-70 factor [Actinoplanes ianthinogenes]
MTVVPDSFAELRPDLVRFCYRMLGSAFEADDAAQETMLRAWRRAGSFEGRSSVRTWIYRIATNVCLDLLRERGRRAVPIDLGPASPVDGFSPAEPAGQLWLTPLPTDPGDVVADRESIRLAFVAALQHLPARQRAVLILRDVLAWPAAEVAALLDASTGAVNAMLLRARATLATRDLGEAELSGDEQDLVARYADAFQRYDVDTLVTLLHEDAVQTMPPIAAWIRGAAEMGRFMLGPGHGCRGSRLIRITGNAMPGHGHYRWHGDRWLPWAIQLVDVRGDRIAGLHNFLDTRLFEVFRLPAVLFPPPGTSNRYDDQQQPSGDRVPR